MSRHSGRWPTLGVPLLLAVLLAGCGGGAPSEAPASLGDAPTGCLGLDESGCAAVAEAVVAALPPDHPPIAYLQAGPFHCRTEGCPPGLVARPEGGAVVEFVDHDPVAFRIGLRDGRLEIAPHPNSFVVAVAPASARLNQPATRLQLGHCGLLSGIDVDGSFWDPVGFVDPGHADAINGADAMFTLMSPLTAELRTGGGLVVRLVRHRGPKHLPACD